MATLVELTLHGTKEMHTINFDQVSRYWRPPGTDYTVVEFVNGKTLTFNEVPDDIWNHVISSQKRS